jgi:hypothetical protein
MSKIDRVLVNRLLAKACAYKDCDKPEEAAAYFISLMGEMANAGFITHEAVVFVGQDAVRRVKFRRDGEAIALRDKNKDKPSC